MDSISEKQGVSVKRVTTIAGSFIALLIGSGFATGQEVLQYFASYGWLGMLGILIIFLMFTYVGLSFITVGYEERFENPNDVFTYYGGNIVGKFFDYFSIVFIYASFIVMLSGSGATVVEQYQLPNWVGSVGMMVIAVTVVILGLDRIVDIIGNIGPIIVILSIFVGLVSIISNIGNIQEAGPLMQEAVANDEVLTASPNFLIAAFSYVGFCLFWLAAFLSQIGASTSNKKEASLGGFWGAAGFSLGVLVMALGILLGIEELAGSQIPALLLAEDIHPLFASIFSLTILLGIFTTSVPLLWTVSSRFVDEKTPKFTAVTITLGVLGVIIAMFVNFDVLVNYVYVISGYVGFVLILIMLWRDIKKLISKN